MNKIINRTHTCGELSIKDLDKEVSLNGWISKRRDLGGLIFFDLRDRYGITQVVFDEKKNEDCVGKALLIATHFKKCIIRFCRSKKI